MFFRISFKAWHNLAVRKERRDTLAALHGEKFAQHLKEHIEDSDKQVVTIELPPRYSEYTSDEDDESVHKLPGGMEYSASLLEIEE